MKKLDIIGWIAVVVLIANSVRGEVYMRNLTASGNWSAAEWSTDAGATYNQSWADGNTANITAANGVTLTLDSGVSANQLLFNVNTDESATFNGTSSLTLTGTDTQWNVSAGKVTTNVQLATGSSLVKTGDGTLEFNRATGNGATIDSLIINQGMVVLNASISHNWSDASEGYFNTITNGILVNAGGELRISSSGNLRRSTAVTVDGGTLTFNHQDYFHNLTLKNGAVVREDNPKNDRLWRMKSGTVTVDGTTGSTISAKLCFVSDNTNLARFTVNDTSSDIDLDFSGQIYDHDDSFRGIVLNKLGTGVLRLSNNTNSWYAGMKIDAGSVLLAAQKAAGPGRVDITAGGTLRLTEAGTFDVSGLTGTGRVSADGAGATLNLGAGVTNAGQNTTFSGTFGETVALVKTGSGIITLNSTTQGKVVSLTVKQGKLVLNPTFSWGANATNEGYFKNIEKIDVLGGELEILGRATVARTTPVTVDAGILSFRGEDYLNNLTLKNGAVVRNTSNSPKLWRMSNTGSVTVAGDTGSTISAEICFVGSMTEKVTFDVANTSSAVDLSVSGAIYNHDGFDGIIITKTGAGVMELSNNTNAWSGGLDVQAGTMRLSADNAAGKGRVTVAAGGSLELTAGGSYNVASITDSGAINITDSGAATLNLGIGTQSSWANGVRSVSNFTSNDNSTISGQLATGLTLVKKGTGELTFNRSNGNEQAITKLQIDAGKVTLATGSNWENGYFHNATIEVNSGAELLIKALAVGKNQPLIVDGGTVSIYSNDYISNLTLKNGAVFQELTDVTLPSSDKKWRSQGTVTVSGDTGSTINAKLTLVKQGTLDTMTFHIADTTSEIDLTMSGRFVDHPKEGSTDYSGVTLIKTGAGTMRLTTPGGNGGDGRGLGMAGTVSIREGVLELAGSGSSINARSFGYFANPVEVSNGATLRVVGMWNANQTPLTVTGDNSKFELNAISYVNNLTLAEGADVKIGAGKEFRTGYMSAPSITVAKSTSGLGSVISTDAGGVLMLVKDTNAPTLTINVNDTGAENDLTITAPIVDLKEYTGQKIVKTGSGTLLIAPMEGTSGSFAGDIFVEAGTLRLAGTNPLGTSTTKKLVVGNGSSFEAHDGFQFAGTYQQAGNFDVFLNIESPTVYDLKPLKVTGNVEILEGSSITLDSQEGMVIDYEYLKENPITLIDVSEGTLSPDSLLSIPMIYDSNLLGGIPDLRLMAVWNADANVYQTQIGVPEPATWTLFGLGLGLLFWIRRKRTI